MARDRRDMLIICSGHVCSDTPVTQCALGWTKTVCTQVIRVCITRSTNNSQPRTFLHNYGKPANRIFSFKHKLDAFGLLNVTA